MTRKGNVVPSCTIITTAANDFLSRRSTIRMPVILPREIGGACGWIRGVEDPAFLIKCILFTLPGASDMDAYEVSTIVNYARNDGPEVIARVV